MTTRQTIDDPEIGDIRRGDEQDWPALGRYLRNAVGGQLRGPMQVQQFPNGSANLTFLVSFSDVKLVIRRPPRGDLPVGAHDMAREYRVLSQLWIEYPRAPRAMAYCEDTSIIGAPFLVVEYRTGAVIRSELPVGMRNLPDVGAKVSAAFVEAVGDLHLVNPHACGLMDLGRPGGFAARQLAGWRARWDACRPGDELAVMDEIADQLAADIPTPQRVSLVHSDLKLDNCQFEPADPSRVKSVFDWDMTTLGDPLIDLGTALSYWPEAGPAGDAARALWPGQDAMGLWSRDQMRAEYGRVTGLDVTRTKWYEAFGSWKTAVALQQLAVRAQRGQTGDPRLAGYADIVPRAVRAALERLN
jgi:aminoglycoside phosphotransferase (APT) family kinase protein